MGTYLSARELAEVEAAENAFRSPVPTQMISNGEFNPLPQTAQQKQVEARIKELADLHGASSAWTVGSSCAPVVAWRRPSWP